MVDYTLIRFAHGSNKFEILVKPDPALEYRTGKKIPASSVLISDDVYTDSGRGTRASAESLLSAFGTDDPAKAAVIILKKGTLNLTTDQRRKMIEAKRRQVIEKISKTYVDPRTHLPHPPLRIEQALQAARVGIDPQKPVVEQLNDIVEKLRSVIPLRSEAVTLDILIPAQFAAQSYSVLKSAGKLVAADWQTNGSLKAILEISAAGRQDVIERLNQVTRGTVDVEIAK